MSSSKCVFANGSRNGAAMSADFVPGLASHVLPGLEALCVLASMVALVVLTGLAQAAQVAAADSLETFDVAPVWQLDVAQDSAGLIPRAVVNEFTGGRRAAAFPVQELPMRRAMRNTSGVGEQLSWSMRVELGCLCVATDGRIDSTGMSLFPADQVAVDPLNGKLARLRLLNPSASAPQVPAEWRTLPLGDVTRPKLVAGTLLHGDEPFRRGSPSPVAHFEDRIYYGGIHARRLPLRRGS